MSHDVVGQYLSNQINFKWLLCLCSLKYIFTLISFNQIRNQNRQTPIVFGLSGNVVKHNQTSGTKEWSTSAGLPADPPTPALARAATRRPPGSYAICLRIPRWAEKNMNLCPSQEGWNPARKFFRCKDYRGHWPWRGIFPSLGGDTSGWRTQHPILQAWRLLQKTITHDLETAREYLGPTFYNFSTFSLNTLIGN